MRRIKYVLFPVFTLLFFLGIILLNNYYREKQVTVTQLRQIREIKNTSAGDPAKTEVGSNSILPEYETLYEINNDLIGWIKIEGTKIDYPVMQRDQQFYLTHDFYQEASSAGLPFLDERCDLSKPNQNLMIYAHNMKNGTMFHELLNYLDKTFLNEHPTIYFDSLYEKREYKVISVIQFIDRDVESEIYSDEQTLFLVTCSSHEENGRIAVIARLSGTR